MIKNLLLTAMAILVIMGGFAQTNVFPAGDFEAGNLDGWNPKNPGAGIVITQESVNGGSYAVKLTASATSANAWDLQLATPAIPIVKGNVYKVSFDVRSTSAAKGRISLGAADQFIERYWPDFTTTDQWQTVSYTQIYGNPLEALGSTLELNFDMGSIADMVYYFDNIKVIDLSSTPSTDLIVNGTFEAGIDGWAKWNGGDNALSQATGAAAYDGTGAMKVINETSNEGGQWKTQIHTDFVSSIKIDPAATVDLTYYIRSDAAGSVRCSTTGTNAHYQNDVATTTEWQKVSWQFVADGGETGLNFDLGAVSGTYYIDNVEMKVSVIDNVGSHELTGVSIYPNPAAHSLYINGLKNAGTLQIVNVVGKLMYTASFKGTSTKIDVSALEKGMYILTTDDHQQFKFIKR